MFNLSPFCVFKNVSYTFYVNSLDLGIRELAEQAKASGAYDLAQGVIDAPPPPVLVAALKALPIEQYSSYNNKRGVPEYREAVRNYLKSRGWNVGLEQIMNTAGAMGGIASALLSECRPGARVLLPEPFFVYHKLLLEVLGFKIVYFPVPLNAQPDWEALRQSMEDVEAVILTTPANPTGQIASPKMLQRLSEAAVVSDCLLIVDEMYREFIWSEEKLDDSAYSALTLDKTVVVRSFSKTFAIPGWRVGFTVTSPARIEKMATYHDALYIGGGTLTQHALAAALTDNLLKLNEYVLNLRTRLLDNRDRLAKAFQAYGMKPLPVLATYYMLIEHGRGSDYAAMEEFIHKKIVLTPASMFFSDPTQDTGYIRIHFALRETVVEKVVSILTA